jgi:hypothetical protein
MDRKRLVPLMALSLLPLPTSDTAVGLSPTCFGKKATIFAMTEKPTFGTRDPDVIVGNEKKNDVYGSGGADLICGRGRGDAIHGGPGNDKLSGGPGSDSIEGEGDPGGRDGKDEIFGGLGHDRCNQYILALTGSGGAGNSKRTRSCELII